MGRRTMGIVVLGALAAGLLALQAKESGEAMAVFAILYTPGPAWREGKGIGEQPLKEHGDYVHALFTKGTLVSGGPFLDDSGGLAVIRAASLDEARAVRDADPAVRSGVFRAEVRPWYRVDWATYGKPAPATPEPAAKKGPAIGTVIVMTTRMEKLAEFYREGLGVAAFRPGGPDHLGAALGDVYLGFDRVDEERAKDGFTVWFTVDDLEATFERLVKLGAKPRKKPAEMPWGAKIASVTDPDGNLVGLSQRR